MIRSGLKVSSRGFSSSAFRALAKASNEQEIKINKAEMFPIESISSSLFLSRIPLVTPTLSKFEALYYHYQDELQRRLMWTFPYYYYFKKSSLAEKKFLDKQKWPLSKQPNVFYAKGVPDIKHNRERRQKQVINLQEEQTEMEKLANKNSGNNDDISRPIQPNSRITQADKDNDLKSLERALDKTLYLVVQEKSTGEWKLPSFKYTSQLAKTPLHQHAQQAIQNINAKDLNLFVVTNKPIHVLKYNSQNQLVETNTNVQSKEYIIKSHILAGDFQLSEESLYKDHLWLTNDELKQYLADEYLKQIQYLLSEY